MKPILKTVVILLFNIVMIIPLASCSRSNSIFSAEEFCSALKKAGYNDELRDTDRYFLAAERKTLVLGDENMSVYIYDSNEEMENDAQNIDIYGCSYKTENTSIMISWVSEPHFFKRGNIIVQYIGENASIVSFLNEIIGEEFAGYAKIQEYNQTKT